MQVQPLTSWKTNFLTSHVQPNLNPQAGNFLSSESVVICAGPPIFEEATMANLVPVGLAQNVQVQQQKNIQQLFEVGSRKPFFVPGRTMVSAGISRVMFDGPSLMYALSMYGTTATGPILPGWATAAAAAPAAFNPTMPLATITSTTVFGSDTLSTDDGVMGPTAGDTNTKPGFFFSNLASAFFNKPLGLAFVLYDMEMQPYGGMYLEECYIQSHSFAASSQQTVLVENVSLRCSIIKPISATTI